MALELTRSKRLPHPRPPIKDLSILERTIVRDQDRLCSQCKALDLRMLFSRESLALHGRTVAEFPSFGPSLTTPECPLCKLFQHFRTPWFRTGSKHVRMKITAYLKLLDDTPMLRELDASSAKLFLTVAFIPKPMRGPDPQYLPITEAGCILKLQYPTHPHGGVCNNMSLLNSEIDFTELNAWLSECCESHTDSCAKLTKLEPISGMRVINVCTRDIVPATLRFNYAALSYVWGAEDKGAAQLGFPNPAPKTIEDALQVTKRLGIPYLWVDRYCIRQDRKSEKHDQISKMHLIYHNARITIIAAAGYGPEHGLPGIRGTSRIPQRHVYLDTGLVVAAFPHPTGVIKRSKWASRGWTYQEAAISRRRLAFTEYGAYFECNNPSFPEGIEEPIRRMTNKLPRSLRPRLCGGISAWSSHSIWQHINQFSKRNLSYQEDRLNALLGIFGALERSQKVKGHVWGIPIHAFLTSDFLKSLMWESKEPTGRIIQFPSWSWTGWKGEIDNHHPFNERLMLRQRLYINSSRVNAFVELLDGDIVPLENYYDVSGQCIKNELVSKYIHIRASAFKCNFNLEYRHPNGLGSRYYLSLVDIMDMTPGLNFPSVELFTLWKTKGTNLEERLASETWDVIFWQVRQNEAFFLVLYRFNDYVERFGHFWGSRRMFEDLKLISEDRTFRLG